jgi:hypothetical protein
MADSPMVLRSMALLLGSSTLMCGTVRAYEPSVNYMLHCMGCHTPDGRGEPGHVPSVRNTLVPLASKPEGRKFLVQVPGSAQSRLSDAELAAVLNWMIANLSASPAPAELKKFAETEVSAYRHTPLAAVAAVRERLIAGSR